MQVRAHFEKVADREGGTVAGLPTRGVRDRDDEEAEMPHNDYRYRRAEWVPAGRRAGEQHPLDHDDVQGDGVDGGASSMSWRMYLYGNGDCMARTINGEQCGFPLDYNGSCGVESQHAEAE